MDSRARFCLASVAPPFTDATDDCAITGPVTCITRPSKYLLASIWTSTCPGAAVAPGGSARPFDGENDLSLGMTMPDEVGWKISGPSSPTM
jgi:hypothetical protein